MKYEKGILMADEGKTLRRKRDHQIVGRMITLGYTWVINGVRLKSPLQELPEHYEELSEEEIEAERVHERAIIEKIIGEHVDGLIRERYTLSEELAILRQRDDKPAEFAEYNAFCECCKDEVKRKYNNENV